MIARILSENNQLEWREISKADKAKLANCKSDEKLKELLNSILSSNTPSKPVKFPAIDAYITAVPGIIFHYTSIDKA